MTEALISAAQHVFSPGPLLAMLLMIPVSLFSGLMPGGHLPVAVVILGFAGYLDPWIAVTVIVFHMAANDITENVPSILLGIPGSRSAQATVLDGYPMAQKGLAGVALGASYTCEMVGGLIGAVALFLVLPVARELLRLFGSAEFFLLSFMAILAVAVVSAGAFVKGMLTAALGLAIALIGSSPIGGVVRANLGIDYLWDGVRLGPVVVGLFAIPEMMALVIANISIAGEHLDTMLRNSKRDVYRGMLIALRHWWLLVRSSLIGVFVGALPALGGTEAHWISYAYARQVEKGARETFGKGDVRGIIAADAPNNSVDGAVLIPTVVFGIPGSAGMAILMAVLILSGIQPGPAMLERHLDLTLGLVIIVALGNIVTTPIMLLFAPYVARMVTVPPHILAPIVVGVVTLSAFQATNSIGDLVLVLGFTALGVFMKRYGWPRPPILIAVVLAEPLEKYLWLSLNTYGVSMLARPQFLILCGIMVSLIAMSISLSKLQRPMAEPDRSLTGVESDRHPGEKIAEAVEAGDQLRPAAYRLREEGSRHRRISMEAIGEIVLLAMTGAFFAYMFWQSFSWPTGAWLMPRIAILFGIPFWVARLAALFRPTTDSRAEIMDTGFWLGSDPKGEWIRFVQISGWIVLLYVAIWMFGFHLALPIGVFAYLYTYGRAGWFLSSVVSLAFLAFIVGVFDLLLHITWPEPVVSMWRLSLF
ncbi:MAG: tripartite tricarboxylate transporter permease [Deltaproteobacteria bacterium]|nr:tripartite tricarboxylate transporter permease [Deltaproteobacteria bacterium]